MDIRNRLIDIVKKEYVGPDLITGGEESEEVLGISPLHRYYAGILFPQDTSGTVQVDSDQDTDDNDPIKLANNRQQSAISITVTVPFNDEIFVEVNAGIYSRDEKESQKYRRHKIYWNNEGKALDVATADCRIKKTCILYGSENEELLDFSSCYRYSHGTSVDYTFTLENAKKINYLNTRNLDQHCFFQVEFLIRSKNGFVPLPEGSRITKDEDYISTQLLYRDRKNYAVGHGCAAAWEEQCGHVYEISTSVIPVYEVKPIIPATLEGIAMDMELYSDYGSKELAIKNLNLLCDAYSNWINELSLSIEGDVSISDKGVAHQHIKSCQEALERMRGGVELLKTNNLALHAFELMNRAMLLQQIHYNIPLKKWDLDTIRTKHPRLIGPSKLPDIKDKDTWPNRDKIGKWRPFQIAFILMNLKSMAERECSERNLVDLIWFPTGGGKTEAYLGLSAYTIFVRRLMNSGDGGTAIIMRYTLRLLTSQQFSRAASLICACETIRMEMPEKLGRERISIGLWVGGATSDNTMEEAFKKFSKLCLSGATNNPFLVLKCPWCGAEIGIFSGVPLGLSDTSKKQVIYQCSNPACDFSSEERPLPLSVIDEYLYDNPPTLLIGTVDKFANLPLKEKARVFFGFRDVGRIAPPDLIIQDELHLISGPLGSMVGIYETMIDELCSTASYKPKIIASTATISRAREQCNALYGCGRDNVKQFPPSGLSYADSFFAIEKATATGRIYVGVLTSNFKKSPVMGGSNLMATLLYGGGVLKQEFGNLADPYWTNVAYFNAMRELGRSVTYYSSEMRDQLRDIYSDHDVPEELRRIPKEEPIELTSRKDSADIPDSLKRLETSLPEAEDLCFSSNMISVGVDISRLGLMTVFGQPKTQAEYIQASSRVGRDSSRPGVVFTYYNIAKSRDRSCYERFINNHSKLYAGVEPTSVTPFAIPVRNRALPAVIIGITRLKYLNGLSPEPENLTDEIVKDVTECIIKRVKAVAPDEVDNTEREVKEIFKHWKDTVFKKWGNYLYSNQSLPLMVPTGSYVNEAWKDAYFEIPTSMRNVEAECQILIMYGYGRMV